MTAEAQKIAFALKEILNGGEVVACDLETEEFSKHKLHSWDLACEGVGLWTPSCSVYAAPQFLTEDFREILKTKKLLFHNAKFDLQVLEEMGYNVNAVRYEDTLIMAWLADENGPLALKDLAEAKLGVSKATRFVDLPPKPVDNLFARPEEDMREWREIMGRYCLKDCEYTWKLYHLLYPQLEKEGLLGAYENVERPVVQVLRKMERTGVCVNIPKLKEIGQVLIKEAAAIESEITKSVPGLNIASAQQLRDYFYVRQQYTPHKDYMTNKGVPSVDADALKWLKEKHNDVLASRILEYREYAKLKSTYCDGMEERARDGIIYASFNQTGTVTGRLSSSSPNLQNIPRRSDQYDIRQAFIPRDGYVFVTSDYSQVELRLVAAFSKCKVMIETYEQGGDIHKATADKIGCERSVAKAINFGLNYGRTAHGMARGLGIKESEAQKFIDDYFKSFPEVLDFMEKAKAYLRGHGYVITLAGRRRRLPQYTYAIQTGDRKLAGRLERQAGNAVIQGSAADVIKRAMLRLEPRLAAYGARTLLQIHDELIVESPRQNAEFIVKAMKEVMEGAANLGKVKLVAEPKITEAWAK